MLAMNDDCLLLLIYYYLDIIDAIVHGLPRMAYSEQINLIINNVNLFMPGMTASYFSVCNCLFVRYTYRDVQILLL